jgi:hypothetical protein
VPWTKKQFAYLQSSGSPLTAAQKAKQRDEAHADPSLIHRKTFAQAAKRTARNAARD